MRAAGAARRDGVRAHRGGQLGPPGVFSDPGTLDWERSPNPHLAFGHGVHVHCLGAQLARMELQVALGALLDRLPGLRPAVGEGEIEWKTGMQVRGPRTLPVRW